MVIYFLADSRSPENSAAMLMWHKDAAGAEAAVLAETQRPADLAFMLSNPVEIAPRGVTSFVACMVRQIGTYCADDVAYCARFRVWQVILACLVGRCGPQAAKAAWSCKKYL